MSKRAKKPSGAAESGGALPPNADLEEALREAVESVEQIISFEPAAAELIDDFILRRIFAKVP